MNPSRTYLPSINTLACSKLRYEAVFEKSEGQKDRQNRAKQKDYTSPALAGAGDYNKLFRNQVKIQS